MKGKWRDRPVGQCRSVVYITRVILYCTSIVPNFGHDTFWRVFEIDHNNKKVSEYVFFIEVKFECLHLLLYQIVFLIA